MAFVPQESGGKLRLMAAERDGVIRLWQQEDKSSGRWLPESSLHTKLTPLSCAEWCFTNEHLFAGIAGENLVGIGVSKETEGRLRGIGCAASSYTRKLMVAAGAVYWLLLRFFGTKNLPGGALRVIDWSLQSLETAASCFGEVPLEELRCFAI